MVVRQGRNAGVGHVSLRQVGPERGRSLGVEGAPREGRSISTIDWQILVAGAPLPLCLSFGAKPIPLFCYHEIDQLGCSKL